MDWKEALKAAQESGQLPAQEDELISISDEGDAKPGKKTKQEPGRPRETLHIELDKKNRHGKKATIIYGFECDEEQLRELGKSLRQATGVGGSQRGGEILLQGDCRERARRFLEEKGYKIK